MDTQIPNKQIRSKSFVSRVFMTVGLTLLFTAIFLVYLYAILRIGDNWRHYIPGPGSWIDHNKLDEFYLSIKYNYTFRVIFILIIIGVFLASFFSMLLHNSIIKRKDKENLTHIVIIHDDILHVNSEKDELGNLVYNPEKFVPKTGFYSLEDLYRRKGVFKIILKIANVGALLSILSILWVFFRISPFAFSSVYYANYLSTDEAYFIINASVTFLLVYFLLRCPDFIKSLAATGFKRIYIKKIHLHETFIGMLLTIGGILLVLNAEGIWNYLDKVTGLFLLLLGVFMIGRDWKDFVMGKFLRD
ncbi:MAG: hypothetical protein JW776_13955 [Candidatus Lokiarchaeota archaeon]|nr:hypothetical protein [Candidatus Lokiarchaeota archaeon]